MFEFKPGQLIEVTRDKGRYKSFIGEVKKVKAAGQEAVVEFIVIYFFGFAVKTTTVKLTDARPASDKAKRKWRRANRSNDRLVRDIAAAHQ